MKKMTKASKNAFINYGIVVVFFIVFQIMLSTGNISSSLSGQLIPICAYVVMALSLNLVVGMDGEFCLGHAGCMSVGAFSGVIAATSLSGIITLAPFRLLISMVIAAVCATIASIIIGIPVLRLRGDYLAIVTLAFGEIIKNILNCLYVGFDENGLHFGMTDANALGMSENGVTIINGPMGALGITKTSTLQLAFCWCFLPY